MDIKSVGPGAPFSSSSVSQGVAMDLKLLSTGTAPLIDPQALRSESEAILPLTPTLDTTEKPLLDRGDRLAAAVLELVERRPLNETRKWRCARLVAHGVAFICSFTAKIFFVYVLNKVPNAVVFDIAMISTFLNLEYQSIKPIIEELFGPKGEHEVVIREVRRRELGSGLIVATVVVSVVGGVVSQLPSAAPPLDYMSGDIAQAIGAFTVTLASASFFPIRSLQLTTQHAGEGYRVFTMKETERRIYNARQLLLQAFSENKNFFLQSSLEDKFKLIAELAKERTTGDAKIKTEAYAQRWLHTNDTTPMPLKNSLGTWLSSIFTLQDIVCAWATASFQYAMSEYSWYKTVQYTGSEGAGWLAAAIVAIAGTILTNMGVYFVLESIKGFLKNRVRDCKQIYQSVTQQLRPYLTLGLQIIGVVLDFLALRATTVIWPNFYASNINERGEPIPHPELSQSKIDYRLAMIYGVITCLLVASTLEAVNTFARIDILRHGDPQELAVLQESDDLQRYEALLADSSLHDFATYLLYLPENLRNPFLDRVSLKPLDLQRFVGLGRPPAERPPARSRSGSQSDSAPPTPTPSLVGATALGEMPEFFLQV